MRLPETHRPHGARLVLSNLPRVVQLIGDLRSEAAAQSGRMPEAMSRRLFGQAADALQASTNTEAGSLLAELRQQQLAQPIADEETRRRLMRAAADLLQACLAARQDRQARLEEIRLADEAGTSIEARMFGRWWPAEVQRFTPTSVDVVVFTRHGRRAAHWHHPDQLRLAPQHFIRRTGHTACGMPPRRSMRSRGGRPVACDDCLAVLRREHSEGELVRMGIIADPNGSGAATPERRQIQVGQVEATLLRFSDGSALVRVGQDGEIVCGRDGAVAWAGWVRGSGRPVLEAAQQLLGADMARATEAIGVESSDADTYRARHDGQLRRLAGSDATLAARLGEPAPAPVTSLAPAGRRPAPVRAPCALSGRTDVAEVTPLGEDRKAWRLRFVDGSLIVRLDDGRGEAVFRPDGALMWACCTSTQAAALLRAARAAELTREQVDAVDRGTELAPAARLASRRAELALAATSRCSARESALWQALQEGGGHG